MHYRFAYTAPMQVYAHQVEAAAAPGLHTTHCVIKMCACIPLTRLPVAVLGELRVIIGTHTTTVS